MASIFSALRRPSPRLLTVLFAGSGVLHFAIPRIYESIIPRRLPRRRELVYASGVAELVCAAGLAKKAWWAGPATAAVLLAVWPANISMAVQSTKNRDSTFRQALTWARIPLQIPLVRGALAAP